MSNIIIKANEKIKKLLGLSRSNNIHESESAKTKARELMAKHDIVHITINKDHLVYSTKDGEYHITPELLLEKGKDIDDFVIGEIEKKKNSEYQNKTIVGEDLANAELKRLSQMNYLTVSNTKEMKTTIWCPHVKTMHVMVADIENTGTYNLVWNITCKKFFKISHDGTITPFNK